MMCRGECNTDVTVGLHCASDTCNWVKCTKCGETMHQNGRDHFKKPIRDGSKGTKDG